jgi:hypothetical protein
VNLPPSSIDGVDKDAALAATDEMIALTLGVYLVFQEDCHRRRKKLKPNIVEPCLHDRAHFDGAKASIAQKLLKLRRAGEGMFASLDPRSFRPEHLIERAYK